MAALGDAPARVAETLTPLVDRRIAMLTMGAAFHAAKESAWLVDWGLLARLLMVRRHDQHAFPQEPRRLLAPGCYAILEVTWKDARLIAVGEAPSFPLDIQGSRSP